MADPRDLPELEAFLVGIPFFAALDEASRLELAGQLEPVHVAAGDVVFRQGDAGDGLYLVLSGRLRVSVATEGGERMLHDLGRGAVVGEIALLTDRVRTATVHAVRDSDLQVLRAPVFQALAERSPALMSGMMRLLADRLLTRDRQFTEGGTQALPPVTRAIVVAAAGQDPGPAATVGGRLAEQLAKAGRVRRVDAEAAERELGPGAAQRGPGDPGRGELTGWLAAVERDHDYVIYQTEAADTAWSRLCLSQADVVLLVASADGDPAIGPVEARALATPSLRCELALLHAGQPSGTARWLDGRAVADHHHLRDGHPADAARLARMITGTGCGLVLGGGGPRGFAHLGVIRALEEAGVPIDVVGGTSIGAIMAALCARGLDDAARVQALSQGIGRLVTLTLPLVSVSSGRRVDRLVADRITAVPIEDLPRPFFCVSASLTRAEEVIHDRGPLSHAVRASVSLPGIFPPVYADGDLLVDGATLNNVPADVMRGRVGRGCVVAVDLSPEVEPLKFAPFGPGLSGWRVLGRRLNPFTSAPPVPGIGYILTRSPSLNQVRHRRTALDGDRIELLLRPPVGGFGALDFKGAGPLIEAGYSYTAEALATSGLAQRFAT
jgi:predicted acylesterase/phospholipase RssA/CRP-like cAMP-binding protein